MEKDKLLCVPLPFFLLLSPQKVKADDDDDIPGERGAVVGGGRLDLRYSVVPFWLDG